MAPHSTDVAEYASSEGLRLRASEASSPESEMTPLKKYTLEDVSHHSSPADCWLVIWGKVYDVTRWYELMQNICIFALNFARNGLECYCREISQYCVQCPRQQQPLNMMWINRGGD